MLTLVEIKGEKCREKKSIFYIEVAIIFSRISVIRQTFGRISGQIGIRYNPSFKYLGR